MKHPHIIYLCAILYIFAPLLNLALTLRTYEVRGMTNPTVLWHWAQKFSWTSWALLGILMLSGVALLVRRKWSWVLAISMLFVSVGANTISGFTQGVSPLSPEISFFSSLTLILVLVFFRFPYFDRREQLLSVAERFPANLPVRINQETNQLTIIDLSHSGALIEWGSSTPPPVGEMFECTLGKKLVINAKVVRAGQNTVGVEFCYLQKAENALLKKIIRKIKSEGPLANALQEDLKASFDFLY